MNNERMREKQATLVVAAGQARELAEAGHGLLTQVRHLYRVRPGGQRTLHTVLADWADDWAAQEDMCSAHASWYRRPSIGDVLTGEVRL